MDAKWINEVFSTCEAGASSAFEPELIPQNQLAWLRNGRIRGGKSHTRPFLRQRLVLPQGLVQGGEYFSVQGGMIVVQIAGRIYRLRIGITDDDFSYEEIPLDFLNSPVLPTVWMTETVGYLVIQDSQSNPIIYDGSTARRSVPEDNEVPKGKMMAFGNGRLWVAVNTNEVVAGDIKTATPGSELKFTESQYFLGGGAFYFPVEITGLSFIPASGAAGYGALCAFGLEQTHMIRADVAQRNLWPDMPGFIQPLLLNTGSIGQWGICQVNQDLYWRDGDGGIRSLRSAIADETGGPGLTPMSREVSRITDFESVHRLTNCSSILFDNRLLMTASPFINRYGKTSFRDLIALDFSPVSSMRGKSAPSYDGEWDGLLFDKLITGKFDRTKRAFVISTDYDGNNRLWEITDNPRQEGDTYYSCMGTATLTESSVPMVTEYPSRIWGDPKRRKLLQRCDVYLSDIKGDCELEVYFRADNYQKWTLWDTIEMCSRTTDPATTYPHVWKNLLGQERPQIKTFTIMDEASDITDYALKVGFQHQIRTVIRGEAKVQQINVFASMLDEEQYADRTLAFGTCLYNDVTGNEVDYLITPGCTMPVGTATCEMSINLWPVFPGSWSVNEVPIGVDPNDVLIETNSETDNATITVPSLGDYVFRLTGPDGRTMDYPSEFVCSGQYFLDLTEYSNDGTGLESTISINVYAYDGVPTLRLIGSVGYEFFGSVVDITGIVKTGWSSETQSVVFFRFYQLEAENLEQALDIELTSYSGVSLETASGVTATYVGPVDAECVTIPDVDAGSFVATVAIPAVVFGPGSLFKSIDSFSWGEIPAISQYIFNDFTLEFWQYISSSPTPQNFGRMVDNNFGSGFATDYRTGNGVEIVGPGINTTTSSGVTTLDAWHHYAFRRSGTTMTIWVDGVIVKTGIVSSSTMDTTGHPIRIGGPAESLESYTSDLRFWNVARSDSDITNNYQSRLTGSEPGLVMYYPIYETDSFFVDYTGNNVPIVLKTNVTSGIPVPGIICYDPRTPPCFP